MKYNANNTHTFVIYTFYLIVKNLSIVLFCDVISVLKGAIKINFNQIFVKMSIWSTFFCLLLILNKVKSFEIFNGFLKYIVPKRWARYIYKIYFSCL